jgi:hypothetical protein
MERRWSHATPNNKSQAMERSVEVAVGAEGLNLQPQRSC